MCAVTAVVTGKQVATPAPATGFLGEWVQVARLRTVVESTSRIAAASPQVGTNYDMILE